MESIIIRMAEVTLQEIDRDNWGDIMDLSLRLEQGGLSAPNFHVIGEYGEPSYVQVGIYSGSQIVGFAMYGFDPDEQQYWIYRLMIDQAEQHKGYGRAALVEIITRLRENPDCDAIYMGHRPENMVGASLLGSFGFRRTGQMLYGEFITRLDLKNPEQVEKLEHQLQRQEEHRKQEQRA